MDLLRNGAMMIQRAQVQDCLRSLAFALIRQPNQGEYQQGFADALMSVALSVGVDREFLATSEQIKSLLAQDGRQ